MSNTITPLIQDYIVDFASNNNFFFAKGVQGDGYGTRYARLSLSNNGQPYEIDGNAVNIVIRGTKPDTKQIFNTCEVVDNSTIQFELTPQMLASGGKGSYEISVMSRSENRVLTSFPFFVITSQSAFDAEYVTSSDEFTLLVSKINEVDVLNEEVAVLKEETTAVIEECNTAIDNSEIATSNAIEATNDMRSLETTVSANEAARQEAEELRQTNTATAIQNSETATANAIAATNDLRDLEATVESNEAERVAAENLRQTNTESAIQNAEQATSDAINAKEATELATENANTAIEEIQTRLDEYDSLNVQTVVQDAINATDGAIQAQENVDEAVNNANTAASSANQAAQEARDAIAEIQSAIGIDDTKESTTTAWSSSHTKQVINSSIENAQTAYDAEIKQHISNEIDTKIESSEETLRNEISTGISDTKTELTENINTSITESEEKTLHYDMSNITILPENWTDNSVYIKSEVITENSIIEIYYSQESLYIASDLGIIYVQGNGYIKLSTESTPVVSLVIDNIIINNNRQTAESTISGTL